MQQTYTFMSIKLTEILLSNVLDWIMYNLDRPVLVSIDSRNGLFHTYASKQAIVNRFKIGEIKCSYFHPKYSKHVIVAYCQANKMLVLIALQADIGVDEQYEI